MVRILLVLASFPWNYCEISDRTTSGCSFSSRLHWEICWSGCKEQQSAVGRLGAFRPPCKTPPRGRNNVIFLYFLCSLTCNQFMGRRRLRHQILQRPSLVPNFQIRPLRPPLEAPQSCAPRDSYPFLSTSRKACKCSPLTMSQLWQQAEHWGGTDCRPPPSTGRMPAEVMRALRERAGGGKKSDDELWSSLLKAAKVAPVTKSKTGLPTNCQVPV